MSAQRHTGLLWVDGRDVAEVAKLLRRDIRIAADGGTIPAGTEISVRVSRSRTCRTLNVTVTRYAGPVYSRERVVFDAEPSSRGLRPPPWMDAAAARLLENLERMAANYNRTAIEPQADYYDCEFFVLVAFAPAVREADHAAIDATAALRGLCILPAVAS